MTANQDTNQNASIVFFGGSEFSLPSLEATASIARELLVVTHVPTRIGREQTLTPSLVALRAQGLGLEVLEVANLGDESLLQRLETFQPTAGVCASFGMIFPASFLTLFAKGIVNVHPSLLPQHRGPSPVQWTIHGGDKQTGATLFVIDEQVDHGPIIAQERVAVPPEVSAPELMASLAVLGGTLLERTLPRYLVGGITPEPQNHAAATLTPMLTRDTGKINWATDDAAQIERNIRAFTPWPGVWCLYGSQRLIIEAAEVLPEGQTDHPGTVTGSGSGVLIATVRGSLRPRRLQREGGKFMDIENFLRGHSSLIGTQLH